MMRSTLSTPPRAPRLRLTPAPEIVGAPHPFVGTMSTPDLLRRSELPSTEETPGRRDYDASGAYELTEDWWAKTYGEDEESSTGRGQRPCEMPPAKRAAHERAKAKKKAEGADELEAAAAALKAHDLYKKKNYQAILAEVEGWAKRGGTVLTAAKWIRCLMSKGDDRLTPSVVRSNYQRTWPGAA